MAKKKGSADMISPLYANGDQTNGPVAGPKGGKSVKDPFGYLSATGDKAPGGSPSDREASSTPPRATAH